ncbi:MAG: stage III sporulation protein AB [Christensenellales bacterium]
MLRALCAVMVMAGCTMIGIKASRDLKERLLFIKDMVYCMNLMKIRLEYDIPPCRDLLYEVQQKAKSDEVQLLLRQVIANMELNMAMENAWENAVASIEKKVAFFKKEEKTAILRFGSLLGSSHRQGQLSGLCSTVAELEQVYAGIFENYAPKAKFYKSLGAIVGIMLAIVII